MLKKITAAALLVTMISGCASYTSQFVSFRPPQEYGNHQQFGKVTVGAEAYADGKAAKQAFGFDIKGSGNLLPVQVVLTNDGDTKLQIVTGQTFLVDGENRYWPLVPNKTAVDRLEKSTELASFFGSGAGKGVLLGTAAGTVLGAALGVASGKSVARAMGTGAALGAAGGAVIGGAKEGTSGERERTIWDDIRNKGLEGKQLPPQGLAHGFLFFPGEAASAKELRVQFRDVDTGDLNTVVLKLAPEPAGGQK